MDTKEIIKQIINNIDKSMLINEPFAHKFVENVLPFNFEFSLTHLPS